MDFTTVRLAALASCVVILISGVFFDSVAQCLAGLAAALVAGLYAIADAIQTAGQESAENAPSRRTVRRGFPGRSD